MKLNLLPAYIRQAKRNRNAFFLMLAVVVVALLGFGYWTMKVKSDLAAAREQDQQMTPQADAVVALAKSADKVYEENGILFRDVELTWYIDQHNLKYPVLYRKLVNRLPSFVRLLSLQVSGVDYSKGAQPVWHMKGEPAGNPGQPTPAPAPGPAPAQGDTSVAGQAAAAPSGDSLVTVKMQAVLGNYAQYSDVMIALVRRMNKDDDFIREVARSGFRQNAGGPEGGGVEPGVGQGAAATFSTVELTALVKANLVPPNPLIALAAAAKGNPNAAAGFGEGGGEGAPGGGGPGPGMGASPGGGPGGPGMGGPGPAGNTLKGKLQGRGAGGD